MSKPKAASIDLAQLDKLEALAAATYPGPWETYGDSDVCNGAGHVASAYDKPTAAFIAAANPATVQQLIALARRSLTSGAPAEDTVREHLARVFDAMPANETLRGSQIAGRIRAGMSAGAAAKTDQALPLLQAAARAWNNENEPALDAAMQEIEVFLLDHRNGGAAGAGSEQAYDATVKLLRDTVDYQAKKIADLEAAPSVTVQDERAPKIDVKHEFEKWASNRGESAVYIGDGLYRSSSVTDQAEAFAAGVELGRAAHPGQDGEKDATVCDLPPAGWHCTRKPGHDGPCAAWPELGKPVITDDELAAFNRFCECAEDFDSGGHDVPKNMMKRLAAIGLVRSCGFGRHETTLFGDCVRELRSAAQQDAKGEQ